MATGLYLTPDGRVAVNYGTRKLFLPMSQYKANGYKPGIEKLSVRDTTGPGPIPIGARAVSDQSVSAGIEVIQHSSGSKISAQAWSNETRALGCSNCEPIARNP